MAKATVSLSIVPYICEPCSQKQGTPVRELVRMVPKAVVFDGKMIGDEYFCCPICFEPKFEAKTRKPVKRVEPAAHVAKDPRSRSTGQRTRAAGVRLVE